MPSFHVLVTQYLWPVTWSFSLVSLMILLGLIVFRIFADRIKDKRFIRQKEIEKNLLIHLGNPLQDLKTRVIKQKSDFKLLAEVASTMLRVLKGGSYERLLEALQEIGLYDWALKGLASDKKKRCIAAINLLIYWPSEEVKSKLMLRLKDSNSLVKYAAVEALAQMKDKKFFASIIQELNSQTDISSPLISDVLQKMGPTIIDELVEQITNKNTPKRIKTAALLALSQTGDAQAVLKTATPLCSDKSDELRALAYLVLSRSGESLTSSLVEQGLRDKYWLVRQYAVDCAVNVIPVPIEALTKLLEDTNWLVGLRSSQAIFSSGGAGQKLLSHIAQKNSIAGNRAKMILSEKQVTYAMV